MENNRQLQLGTEGIRKLLLRFAVPSIIAMTATSLYNMVDSIFIGQRCGEFAISGLAVTFPLMNLSGAFGAMVGIGASTLVSVKMGQRDHKAAESVVGNAVIMNVVIGILFMVVALAFLDPILIFFGASSNTLPDARAYMQTLLYGNVITHLYLGLNDIVRATGYPQRAMAFTLSAVVSNIFFDYLFIYVFEMGIRGAAVGTLCAQAIAFGCEMVHFNSRNTYLRFSRRIFHFKGKVARGIMGIGLSPFLVNCCACFIVILINKGLTSYGDDYYVGAYGISNRIIFFFVMIVMGINQGMQPIVGYNYGARQYDRSLKTFKVAAAAAVIVMSVCFVACHFFPAQIAALFTPYDNIIDITQHALKIMTATAPLIGFQILSVGLFTALGMVSKSIFMSLTRQLIFLIPLLVILPRFWGTDGIWYSLPISDTLSCITAVVLLSQVFRKLSSAAPTEKSSDEHQNINN